MRVNTVTISLERYEELKECELHKKAHTILLYGNTFSQYVYTDDDAVNELSKKMEAVIAENESLQSKIMELLGKSSAKKRRKFLNLLFND